jgi:Tol biopolymer transport system component
LSPDGNLVVFSWRNNGPPDLYIKSVDSEVQRRLTDTPEPEFSPAWSPDGREIAFLRGGKGVFTVAALGGVERRVAETGSRVTWSSDAKSLFVGDICPGTMGTSCVYQISLDTLRGRQVTQATDFHAISFAASPDGRTLAVVGQGR